MTCDANPDVLIGAVLGCRYRVEARLGHGAMGTVYRARHVEVGRVFAIKILHAQSLGDDRTRRRFAREAALAGSLHHGNVVNVVDVGELPDRRRYLVMDYADGPTLLELIASAAPMPGARVISIVRQLCSGLHHAHELGLIHRDFKPDNVIVECDRYGTDTPKIVDFGVAILRDDMESSDTRRLTSAGMVLGTPHYMAPEHATGKPIDHRIDLFALGVTCFEMLTGRAPFDGDGVDLARANLRFATPVMNVRVPGLQVDPLLEAFTRKLMHKSRDARPPSAKAAGELIDLIDRDRRAAALALDVRPTERRAFAALPVTLSPPLPELGTGEVLPVLGPSQTGAPTQPIAPIRARRVTLWVAGVTAFVVLVTMLATLELRHPPPAAAPRLRDLVLDDPSATSRAPPPGPQQQPAPAGVPAAPQQQAAAAGVPAAPALAPAPPPPIAVIVRVTVPVHVVGPRAARRDEPSSPAGDDAQPPAEPTVRVATEPPSADVRVAVDAPAGEPAPEAPAVPATATSVAQLYSRLGRRLKALDEVRGASATADLWPQYLRIRIHDVIGDPEKRDEATAVLRVLEDTIAQRSR